MQKMTLAEHAVFITAKSVNGELGESGHLQKKILG